MFIVLRFKFLYCRKDSIPSEEKSVTETDKSSMNGRSREPINMSDLTLDALMSKSPQVFVQVKFWPNVLYHWLIYADEW